MSFTDEQIVEKYLQLRARRDVLENQLKLDLIPLKKAMGVLEAVMAAKMEAIGKNKIQTEIGTAYKKKIFSVSVKDKTAFLNYAFGQDTLDLLDIKPNEKGVEAHLEKQLAEQMELPENKRVAPKVPGVETSSIHVVQFRKL